jgi:hypothetical protein
MYNMLHDKEIICLLDGSLKVLHFREINDIAVDGNFYRSWYHFCKPLNRLMPCNLFYFVMVTMALIYLGPSPSTVENICSDPMHCVNLTHLYSSPAHERICWLNCGWGLQPLSHGLNQPLNKYPIK